MAYNYCCDCEYLDRKDEYTNWFSGDTKYKCKKCWEYKKLTDSVCSSFKEIKKDTGSYTPSGCYITTIVCDILGYNDNCELLTLLRNFRDNTLKNNPTYLPLLIEYDIIGPTISKRIKKEKNNYIFALGLMNYFLLPCANLIKAGDIEGAIEAYTNMVNQLKDEFELPTFQINVDGINDLENLGKGRIRQPKTSEVLKCNL